MSIRAVWVFALLLLALFRGSPARADEAEDAPEPFPDMAKAVGQTLDEYYYDKKRFHPRVMVERAIRALTDAEMSAFAVWKDDHIDFSIGDGAPERIAAPPPRDMMDAMDLIEALRAKVDAVKAPSFTAERKRDLDYVLVNGALSSLDPHTVLFPPEPAKDFAEDIKGEFYGIGAYLIEQEGVVTIERVMPGLPADRAGVEDSDIILRINAERTAGLSLDQAVTRIKGPKGTTVNLTIERKGKDKPIEIPIVRDLVQVISTRSYRAGDIGYLRMDDFSANTAHELFDDIQDLERQGPLSALVLDLRFNGGGLLEAARTISQFFLPKRREIVRTVTVNGVPEIDRSARDPILGDVPMVVLVSPGSASAAEILSGTLQVNDRAVVAGTSTFGKGSVQQIKDLAAGSKLKLTIQEYQLPGGVSIQDVGVTPDLALIRHVVRKDGNVDLLPYTREREADDEFALKNTAAYHHDSAYELGWVSPYLTREQAKAFSISSRDFHPDLEASMVIDLLQAAVAKATAKGFADAAAQARETGQQRQFLLGAIKDPVAKRAEEESQKLAGILAKLPAPVTWGPPCASAPAAGVTIAYDGPPELQAGQDATLTFDVHNGSPAELGRLYGVIDADKQSPLWEEEVLIGDVAAGKDAKARLQFKVPPRLYDGEERFTVKLYCDLGQAALAASPVSLRILGEPRGIPADEVDALPGQAPVEAGLRPHFSYSWRLEEANGGMVVQPGEPGTVDITLRNDGDANSARVKLYVYKSDDPYVQLGEVRFDIKGGIPKGGEVVEQVPLTVLKEVKREGEPKPFAGDHVTLQIRAEETFEDDQGNEEVSGIYRAMLFSTLKIPVGAPAAGGNKVQPEMTLEKLTALADHQLQIRVRIADDQDKLRYVALFQDEDKVDLQPAIQLGHLAKKTAGGLGVATYTATVVLKPGLNNLRVLAANANDGDDITEVLPIRVWGPTPPGTASTAAPVSAKQGAAELPKLP